MTNEAINTAMEAAKWAMSMNPPTIPAKRAETPTPETDAWWNDYCQNESPAGTPTARDFARTLERQRDAIAGQLSSLAESKVIYDNWQREYKHYQQRCEAQEKELAAANERAEQLEEHSRTQGREVDRWQEAEQLQAVGRASEVRELRDEIDAANERIVALERENDANAFRISPAMYEAKIEQLRAQVAAKDAALGDLKKLNQARMICFFDTEHDQSDVKTAEEFLKVRKKINSTAAFWEEFDRIADTALTPNASAGWLSPEQAMELGGVLKQMEMDRDAHAEDYAALRKWADDTVDNCSVFSDPPKPKAHESIVKGQP